MSNKKSASTFRLTRLELGCRDKGELPLQEVNGRTNVVYQKAGGLPAVITSGKGLLFYSLQLI